MKRILTLGLALLMLALAGRSDRLPAAAASAGHFPLLSGQNGSLGDGSGSQWQTAAPLPCRH